MANKITDGFWSLYISECHDGTLYVGIAKDVKKRIKDHNTTNKCRYTKFRKPLSLLYSEPCGDYGVARKREIEVKRFSRKKKFELISNKE